MVDEIQLRGQNRRHYYTELEEREIILNKKTYLTAR